MTTSARLLLTFIFTFALTNLSAAQQYRGTQSTSGGDAASSSYTIQFTMGEPVLGQTMTSTNYDVTPGFYEPVDEANPIDTAPPFIAISAAPPLSTNAGESITIESTVTDIGSGVSEVILQYRSGGTVPFTSATMTNTSGDVYTAAIPAESITSRGLEFFIEAVDQSPGANRTQLPQASASPAYFPILVTINAPGRENPLRRGSAQSDYRLISAPMTLTAPASSTVLADLGSYDDTRWRLWELKSDYFNFEGEAQYNERANGATFAPGAAFFILSADGGTMRTGQATSISSVTPFTKSLHQGWNFLGNPFDFDVPISAINLSNDLPLNIQSFNGGWTPQTTLSPFQGYIIDAGSESGPVTLSINPNLGAGKQADKTEAVESPALSWFIQIDARTTNGFDIGNLAAVGPGAAYSWDLQDRPEPPIIGDQLSLYFPHDEWGLVHKRFQTDTRPAPVSGDVWRFEVATGTREQVTLSFSGLENVPANYRLKLVDLRSGQTEDVYPGASYSFQSPGNHAPSPFDLIVGADAFVEDQVTSLDLLPGKFQLDQNYPNPFNPTTSIRYGLSEESTVILKVFNLLGQEVAVLVDNEMKSAGYHVSTWDARADDGSYVSSGLYLYQIQITSISSSNAGQPASTILNRNMMFIK